MWQVTQPPSDCGPHLCSFSPTRRLHHLGQDSATPHGTQQTDCAAIAGRCCLLQSCAYEIAPAGAKVRDRCGRTGSQVAGGRRVTKMLCRTADWIGTATDCYRCEAGIGDLAAQCPLPTQSGPTSFNRYSGSYRNYFGITRPARPLTSTSHQHYEHFPQSW
jgi:hypothetical protein